MSTENKPNYRIYDRTGGGARHDIYAESLEAAIEAGREWIEDGDWSSEDGTIRKNVRLECEVRAIVMRTPRPELDGTEDSRVSDLLALESAPESIRYVSYGDMDRDQLTALAEYLDADDESVSEEDAEFDSSIAQQIRDSLDEEDDDITDDQDAHDCSGSHSDDVPECEVGGGDGEGGHVWEIPRSLIGEFPTHSLGGTTYSHNSVCARCGCYRREVNRGSQRNPGESDTIEITEATNASRKWLVEHHEEDGWLPQWLADYLDRPPTTKHTLKTAKEYVRSHSDDDKLDDDDLEHVFAALHGRRANDNDRTDGLWSLCCVYI